MRNLLAAVAAILFVSFAQLTGAHAAPACAAAGFVQNAGEAYDRAARSGSAAAFASAAAQYSDLRAISLFALGQYRKDLPKSQEAEYFRLTRQFIGQTLKKHGSGFRGTSLQITECSTSGGNVVVSARTSGGAKVIFRLARAGGSYTVRDINMKGVWLAQRMRATFVGTISRTGSIDGLINYLGG